MASFDKAIPPGGEGKITLSVDTRGYQGKIHKTARIFTNDRNKDPGKDCKENEKRSDMQ